MTTAAPAPEDPRLLKLRAGEPLEFPAPPTGKEEAPEEKEARTIPAKWLEDLAAKPARVVTVPIAISNAIIAGPLNLQYATFEAELSITDSHFTDEADFSFATFKRSATFQGSRFARPANFRAAHAQADFRILRASFADDTSFQDLHVDEVLQASGATFGSVNFERIEVSKGAFFRTDAKGQRTTFGGDARFHGAHIKGPTDFSGAEFKAMAAFDRLQVDGSAFFRTDAKGQRTTFGGEASFPGAHIQGDADFRGTEFKAPAKFDRLQVDGSAFFRADDKGQRTTFGGEARFLGAHIKGNAEFISAEFQGPSAFDNLHVDGSAFFRPDDNGRRVQFAAPAGFSAAAFGNYAQFIQAEFKAGADFDNAHFQGAADFTSAEFAQVKEQGEARIQKATFVGARFERGAYFNSAQFLVEADFTAAVAERDAQFSGAKFSGPSSFREAEFQVVFFREPSAAAVPSRQIPKKQPELSKPTSFEGLVDLRGFTYHRIYADLPSLLAKISPFDRQPFSQLEKVLRASGDDRSANSVYLERRRVEREQKKTTSKVSWFFDSMYWLGANYGVRPYRLLFAAIILLVWGAVVFSRPAAVQPKTRADAAVATAAQTQSAPASCPSRLGIFAAARMSVRVFLPVELPLLRECEPSEKQWLILRFSDWASLMKIIGWLIVPVGLASITGLLRRVAAN